MSDLTGTIKEYVSPATTGTAHKSPVSVEEAKCPVGYKKVFLGVLHNQYGKSVLGPKVPIVYFMPYYDDVAEMPRINRVEGTLIQSVQTIALPHPYITVHVLSSDFAGVVYESRNRPDFWVYVPNDLEV